VIAVAAVISILITQLLMIVNVDHFVITGVEFRWLGKPSISCVLLSILYYGIFANVFNNPLHASQLRFDYDSHWRTQGWQVFMIIHDCYWVKFMSLSPVMRITTSHYEWEFLKMRVRVRLVSVALAYFLTFKYQVTR
jgi:hypothetical protein